MVRQFQSSVRDTTHGCAGVMLGRCPILLRKICLAAMLVALLTRYGSSQIDNAEIFGIVVDRSGHKIPGAVVALVDTERGIRRTTGTNSAGFYIFSGVRPGNYVMQVSAPGFQSQSVTDMQIFIQGARDENFTLLAGSASDTGTIQGRGTPVNSAGAVSTVVEPTLVSELPLNGRSFQTLFQMVPGVVITASTPTSQGQFSVNGQRANANYVSIDGVSANFGLAAGVNPGQSTGGSLPALSAFGGTNSLISTDDVQEFAILTSSYSAEFGRVPGAQVSIVSRSGTNEFHGKAFDYMRNDAFDANDWFSNRNRLGRAPLRQNDFGFVLGGPISKNRTFFFTSYEGLRLRQPTSRESDVPSLAVRNSASASMEPFFNAYPIPNGPEKGNGLARATYAFSDPSTLEAASIRTDHHIGQSLNVFTRYAYSTSDRELRGTGPNSLSTVTDTRVGLQTLTAGLTDFITTRFISDIRFNWSATSAMGADQLDGFGGATPLSPKTVFPFPFNQKNGLFQFFPAADPVNIALTLGRDNKSVQRQINILGDFSWQLRSHVLKMGFDFKTLSPQITPPSYEQTTEFLDIGSALRSSTLFTAVAATVAVHLHFVSYSFYLQDAWKLNARLSLTYGVRWDYNPAPNVQAINGLKPFALAGIDDLKNLRLAKPSSQLYRTTWSNFGPRVGLTYELRRSAAFTTVLKTGVGTFFDLGNGSAGNAGSGVSFPFLAVKFLSSTLFPLSSDNAAPPPFATKPPFSTIQAFPSILKVPHSYQWNLSLEQSLGTEQTVSIGFVGAVGQNLLRTEEYAGGAAGVPGTFTRVLFTNNAGSSHYNALQVQFKRHSTKGPYILASYTLAHSLDNVSTDASFDAVPARFLNARTDYGPSDFDIRHTATLGLDYKLGLAGGSWVLKTFLSAWLIDPIVIIRSSPPVDVVVFRNIGFGTYPLRPDLDKSASLYIDDSSVPGGRRINPLALSVSSDMRQGNLGRNSFRGFPFLQGNIAIGRRFRITDRIALLGRFEVFNLLNHPNFSPPLGQLGTVDSSGKVSGQDGFGISQTILAQGLQAGSFNTGFSPLFQVGGNRSVQFALRAEF